MGKTAFASFGSTTASEEHRIARMLISPLLWLVWAIVRSLLVHFSRHRVPRRFVRTPRKHRSMAWWVIFYTNQARRRNGKGSLSRHLVLQSAAQRHSDWMGSTKTLSHAGPHGITPHRRIRVAGYAGGTTGENIYKYPMAKGQRKLAKKLVDGWMNSPGHRANILHGAFRYIGVGVREAGGYIWATQNFGG